MARYKKPLGINVLEAARQRVSHVYDVFDTVWVTFSGGKDSLVTMRLALDEATKRGRLPLKVMFFDEELIPRSVLDFVESWAAHPDIDLRWYAYPFHSDKYVLGISTPYIQWDPSRDWVREMPDCAITREDGDDHIYDQYEMTVVAISEEVGRTVVLNGIRAGESLVRYASCINKLNECWMVAPKVGNYTKGKPVYDWSQDDIFFYFSSRCIAYPARRSAGV